MNISVICVGKLKEKYWKEALWEYQKRLGRYCTFSVVEVKEERLCDNASKAEENAVKEEEGKRILAKILGSVYVIALEVQGEALSSEALAERLRKLTVKGRSDVAFLIGGSLGLSDPVLERADLRLSFSRMTFPHQMMRIILLEQLYRCFKIIKNEPYHK